ncbi:hypothetical protein [Roseiconus lacunae]|nr:hypothetical protein [Roseiconus lacunae]
MEHCVASSWDNFGVCEIYPENAGLHANLLPITMDGVQSQYWNEKGRKDAE